MTHHTGTSETHTKRALQNLSDRITELEKRVAKLQERKARMTAMQEALEWIALVNAMDYEYQEKARSVLREMEDKPLANETA